LLSPINKTSRETVREEFALLRDREEHDLPPRLQGRHRLALLYPSPYHVGMSSLGFQAVYRLLCLRDGWAVERAFLPDHPEQVREARLPLLTLETEHPVANFPVVAVSVAYELEIAGLCACLELMGVPALAAERDDRHPLLVGGGPLTFSNPAPLAPFFDVILCGEVEETLPALCALVEEGLPRDRLLAAAARLSGGYVPSIHGDRVPPIAQCEDDLLPARSVIRTPATELRSMFLVEAARGCSRGCTYCVMRRSTNGGMRIVDPERILSLVPQGARRVGLVGAAVSDHPHLCEILEPLVQSGREIGVSSLRADKLTPRLVGLLKRGGYRTLTTAADGASERLRAAIDRRTREKNLLRAAELCAAEKLDVLKIYMMLGLPGETDDDVDELLRFCRELARVAPRLALGIAPFVAKRQTPLDGEPFAGVTVVEARLERLRRGLRGVAEVRPTSARWAWVEYMLAQGGPEAGLAVLDAYRQGATYAAYRRAFERHGVTPQAGPVKVPAPRLRMPVAS
jgi:radical SAM superfamily enzyme YgiQ (UPF0313 family)